MPDLRDLRPDLRGPNELPEPPPLSGLRFAVAGPGRVGRSLARWGSLAGAEPALIISRSGRLDASVDPVLASCPQASYDEPYDDLQQPPLDLVFLTVADGALASVAEHWAKALAAGTGESHRPPPFATVLHSSGSLDAEVLAPLRSAGIAVGSLHPLRAFTDVVEAPGPRPFFAIDGDPVACRLARRLVAAWSGTCCELAADRRVVYHLAASLAAGGVVTVLSAVAQLMRDAELPEDLLEGYLRLLRGAVDTATAGGPGDVASAITGPAARGDVATLRRHLAALRSTSPDLEPLVRSLWNETRRQTAPAKTSFLVDRP